MNKPVALYGKMLAFSRLQINCPLQELDAVLSRHIEPLDDLVPVVIECQTEDLSLDALIDKLWQHQIAVIGVIDGTLNDQARARKMAIFPSNGRRIDRLQVAATEFAQADDEEAVLTQNPAPKAHDIVQKITDTRNTATVQALPETQSDIPTNTQTNTSDETTTDEPATQNNTQQNTPLIAKTNRVHRQMVRSGQSIHHMGGDLIVTNSVNQGAEVATDYTLHIYGKAQGRLVAGATGDESAQIFCQKFEPSLVSVAGTYCLREDIPKEVLGKAVQVRFSKEEGLVFIPIG